MQTSSFAYLSLGEISRKLNYRANYAKTIFNKLFYKEN
jgi:hypothetical protein